MMGICTNSCLLSTGIHAQVQLVQSGVEMRKLGDSVRVYCKASVYTFTRYRMQWVCQGPECGLQWVGPVNSNNGNYTQKFQGRITMTADKSAITAYMGLSSLRAKVMDVHYCTQTQ